MGIIMPVSSVSGLHCTTTNLTARLLCSLHDCWIPGNTSEWSDGMFLSTWRQNTEYRYILRWSFCLPYFRHTLRKRSLFTFTIHHHDTRHKDDFYTHSVNTEFGKRSMKYKRCKLWNNLPNDIKAIKSCYSFKFKPKHFLLQFLE